MAAGWQDDATQDGAGPPGVAGQWRVEVLRDGVGERVGARPVGERSVVVYDVTRPVLVLGSSQRDDAVDWAAVQRRGTEVVRRRSGGSAVLVEPGATVWVDVTIPADDPLWVDDVGRAFHWLGGAWVATLASAGVESRWHDGPMRKAAWSDRVCFAGLGPGEVTVEGRKAVGLSQRRTRDAVLFQCCAALVWEPARLLGLLAVDEAERARGARELSGVAVSLGPLVDPGVNLAATFIEVLGRR